MLWVLYVNAPFWTVIQTIVCTYQKRGRYVQKFEEAKSSYHIESVDEGEGGTRPSVRNLFSKRFKNYLTGKIGLVSSFQTLPTRTKQTSHHSVQFWLLCISTTYLRIEPQPLSASCSPITDWWGSHKLE